MATEILRPNANGNANYAGQYPASGEHWDKVDEASADEDATYLWSPYTGSFPKELFNLPAHSGSGDINKITVYCRCKAEDGATPDWASIQILCRTHDTDYGADAQTVTTSYVNYSKEWATNPNTGSAWTWDEIDALQIGTKLRAAESTPNPNYETRCTQVWVEVEYEEAATPKTSADSGSGAEGTPLPGASLSGSETGSTIDALVARLLDALDIGSGAEISSVYVEGQFKNLFAGELGEGWDGLTAKIEMPNKGGGMKLWT
jgi:hypothetical protein